MAKERMVFIPLLRATIVKNLRVQGIDESAIVAALEQWDRGLEPRTPVERGCFAVFEQIERDVNASR
jgi:hypothetical protein